MPYLGVVRLDLPALGRIRARRATLPPPSGATLAGLSAIRRPALLDPAGTARFTVVAGVPLARLVWRAGHGEVRVPGGARAAEPDVSALLRGALAATANPGTDGPLPYGPGWIGVFGYGLGTAFEDVPDRHPDDAGLFDADLSYYPAVAVHDAEDHGWWMVWREGAEDGVRALDACLRRESPAPPGALEAPLRPRIPRERYLAAVRRAVEYVHAGDVFQVNYAHEFRAPFRGRPLAPYLKLRAANPAPYGAYLDLGPGTAVLSTSPELFLSQRGRDVLTRPIKGTRPRGRTPEEDAALVAELETSEKDGAELAMIVDLERNDLGRVCEPGSIAVPRFGIESYASVHHRVADVVGRLEEGRDRVDLLRAAFPGGSITGAPKIRAMQIIDELEAGRRGPYTGSIGILTDDGDMELNIAIRTPWLARGELRVHVGGGIVADSVPEAEYEETLAKGRAIFEALDR